jgi:tRNA threonylcarbamoyl adenosine modification protein YjeE
MADHTLFLADDDATAAFGRRVAARLVPGDRILLYGDLGAGKTALARSVVRALVGDATLDVPSPTFALVQPYEAEGQQILHADLYRVMDEREVDELGLSDDPKAIVLVEWPARASQQFIDSATGEVQLTVPPGGDGRHVRYSFADERTL